MKKKSAYDEQDYRYINYSHHTASLIEKAKIKRREGGRKIGRMMVKRDVALRLTNMET